MSEKSFPLGVEELQAITKKFPTPFHIYDEAGIRAASRRIKKAFAWNEGFKEHFAVKATPNPYILKLLKSEGFGTDCSSLPELLLSESAGITGEEIMFTSNDTPSEEFVKAREMGAVINLDDISHISFLEESAGIPDLVSLRYNPGPLKGGNAIIGHPEDAKYGFTRAQLFEGYRILRDKGVRRFGLHTMVASNELDPTYFVETAALLFDLVGELSAELKIDFEFVNIGGGIGVPNELDQEPVDIELIGSEIEKEFEKKITKAGLTPLDMRMECGRVITGPSGWLVSRVRHIKDTYKKFVGLDSCMADLMRPALYGAYHHISVPGKDDQPHEFVCDVTGSLCENNDKFAIDRSLPPVEPGDLVLIHDTGAHGHAMGFNYNAKLRSAELLLREDGSLIQIRRAETPEDYFATLNLEGLSKFKV